LIDAVKFATAFTAFWNMATPTCEHFVRMLNLSLYEREDTEMTASSTTDRAYVAEYGFALFVERGWSSVEGSTKAAQELLAKEEARKRIEPLQGKGAISEKLTAEQDAEGKQIALRLGKFFKSKGAKTTPRPIFPGCGLIDHSEADVLSDLTLYEVKTVERGFRSNDIRQLITYCALNSLSGKHKIEKIGLFNPRKGISFELELDLVTREISGKTANDLFEDIHQAISSGGISR
jgi:hypothetical protein